MNPLVYAIVLNRNGEHWLGRCLGSLLESSYRCLRVVLVDNGSTDRSVAVARRIAPQIDILENHTDLGFCAANNVAITYALERGADYVALLNNDTYFQPSWLSRIVEVGEANPQLGIAGPVQLRFDGYEFNSWMMEALPGMLEALRSQDQPGLWAPVEWVEASCLVIKQSVLDRVGRLDPVFCYFYEELDFCRRARAAGFQVGIVPSSKIHHYRGGSFEQPGRVRQRDFFILRNSMIYNSTDPQASLAANLKNFLRNDATHFREALFGRGDPALWWRANVSFAARLPYLFRKWRVDRQITGSQRAGAGK